MGPPRGCDIVCFSNDWGGDPLSKTHIMRILARDSRVLWVNSLGNRSPRATVRDLQRAMGRLLSAAQGVREVERNIHVLAPLYLPAYGKPAVDAVNRWLLRRQVIGAMGRLGMARPITWAFLPSAAVVAGTLGESLVIYHVVDAFSAFSDASPHVDAMEHRLAAAADLVIASSETLLRTKLPLNPHTVLVRHGVDFAHFSRALDPQTRVPDDLVLLPRPIVGFFGLIADWIDLELVREVADTYPQASVALIGKVVTSLRPLAGAPNVHLLGRKAYADLPAYCRAFDLAITPFRLNALGLSASPLKAREYVAAGLPNVCTDLPELRAIPGCIVAHDHAEFVHRVGEAMRAGGPSRERSELVRPERWEARVEEIRGHVAAVRDGRSAA